MSVTQLDKSSASIPPHVPPELLFDFDYRLDTTGVADQHEVLDSLDSRGAPPIFYTRAYGGHWVIRNYAMCHEIFNDHKRFGTYPSYIPPMADALAMIPVQIDPPDHGRYKRILGPLFSPLATRRLEEHIRAAALESLEPLVARRSCDFVTEYSQMFPQRVFLRFMGLPLEKSREFVEWAKASVTGSLEAKRAAHAKISGFLSVYVDERMADPQDDWGSMLVKAKDERGNPALDRPEILNICNMLFVAGLDTVTNAHSHIWRYLGSRPDLQAQLRVDPSSIPAVVEELLRLFPVTNNSRKVRKDMEFHGLRFRAGESLLMLLSPANRDPAQFSDPLKFDIDRDSNVHLTFGAGIHRCIGSNIARSELRISIEEWQRLIPPFRVGAGEITSIGGITMGIEHLPLEWDAP